MKPTADAHEADAAAGACAIVAAFLCFAFAYFFSALARAVTATLAPVLNAELGLSAGDLGLLAGAYFLGFASLQLPLGRALDRLGPKRVLIAFLALAVLGCVAFALARGFVMLVLARALIGMGVGACLMAPMKSFREHLPASLQLRATSWMLMTGSLGMIASTLPVQWLLPSVGWRGLFWLMAAAFVLAMAMIAAFVPRDRAGSPSLASGQGYAAIVRERAFMRYVPLGFFNYGGMVAVQSLWAGPWLTQVCGYTPAEAAAGLFGINSAMLFAFMAWGGLLPRLYRRGWTASRLITLGLPVSLLILAGTVLAGAGATAWVWAAFCVSSTFVSLAQPSIGQSFPALQAGRAISAYNLVIFSGVFAVQWGVGLVIDVLQRLGWSALSAFQGAFALFMLSCTLSYVWFLWFRDDCAVAPPV
jgi:predicted MFS family arabinose efflux permease